MTRIVIDDKELNVEPGMTIIQACDQAGIEIPRFCYHEKLAIAGNCRMCLVEVAGAPKPVASCAMPISENMVVKTNTPLVKKAREGVMEFLLINHPLDCPICDQAGECDLQDQAIAYGRGYSRFNENKRAVKDKDMGPLVKTQMTRCIHCTRCVRFLEDIAGTNEMGAIHRGEHTEITTYLETSIKSELSGNIIDLCPVGALTSKPYAFKARPWELKKTESIDVLDAVGSNIRIDSRGMEVMRILPRLNETINEEWISDKARYACDGLKLQRLDKPMMRVNGKFKEISWDEAARIASEKIKNTNGHKIAAIAGDLADVESMTMLKDLMSMIGTANIDCRQDGAVITNHNRSQYIFNTPIKEIEKADLCLLVGTNPRLEAPIVNIRLRKAYMNGMKAFSIGSEMDLTYKFTNLGDDLSILEQIQNGNHEICQIIKDAKNPVIIIGSSCLVREDANKIIDICSNISEKYNIIRQDWNGFNVMHRVASRVGGLDIGFIPSSGGKNTREIIEDAKSGEIDLIYLLGADEINTDNLGSAFVIYQGHHGDKGANMADLILPGSAYTEKNATYVNLEGKVQRTRLAVFAPGEAREDWRIIKLIADSLGLNLGCESLSEVRKRMASINPIFNSLNIINNNPWNREKIDGKLSEEKIKMVKMNFYMTDAISRASKTMANCTESNPFAKIV